MRVVSWNIFNGLGAPRSIFEQVLLYFAIFGKYSVRDRKVIPTVLRELLASNAELIGLQEVDGGSRKNGFFDQVRQMSGSMDAIFSAERSGRFNDGNLLLTTLRVVKRKEHVLPFVFERRTVIKATLEYKGRKVVVFSTHLAAHPFNGRMREKQLEYIAGLIAKEQLPIVVIGDFNCSPDSKEFSLFLLRTGLHALIKRPTFPNYGPRFCFDNILVSKDWEVVRAKILRLNLSDHLPVLADIMLKK